MASFISLSYIVGRWIKDVSPFSPPPESVLHKGAFRDALCPRHMVGSYPFYQLHVPVAAHSLLIMPWAAQWEDFQPSVTMRSVISWPISGHARCATTYICAEPPPQPLSGEFLPYSTANRDDAALLDIRARGFWGLQQQSVFFDVWVFNPTDVFMLQMSWTRKAKSYISETYSNSSTQYNKDIHVPVAAILSTALNRLKFMQIIHKQHSTDSKFMQIQT